MNNKHNVNIQINVFQYIYFFSLLHIHEIHKKYKIIIQETKNHELYVQLSKHWKQVDFFKKIEFIEFENVDKYLEFIPLLIKKFSQ